MLDIKQFVTKPEPFTPPSVVGAILDDRTVDYISAVGSAAACLAAFPINTQLEITALLPLGAQTPPPLVHHLSPNVPPFVMVKPLNTELLVYKYNEPHYRQCTEFP